MGFAENNSFYDNNRFGILFFNQRATTKKITTGGITLFS